MIREIATLTIDPLRSAEFEAAVAQARPLFLAAEGCHAMRIDRVIETPEVYHLIVEWETLAHHMEIFRNSEAFQTWRSLAGPFFTQAPSMVHTQTV
jgi:quinol monooxygenase YgiN